MPGHRMGLEIRARRLAIFTVLSYPPRMLNPAERRELSYQRWEAAADELSMLRTALRDAPNDELRQRHRTVMEQFKQLTNDLYAPALAPATAPRDRV